MNPVDSPTGLSQLRGLHLPADASSGAQGEVVLAIALGFVAALLVGLVRLIRARARNSVRASALRGLSETRALPSEARLIAQARLLRRLTRTLAGDEAASTQGSEWAAILDRLFATDFFSRGAGAVVTEGLYRRSPSADPETIDSELGRLFARIRA
ncbi:DUF4381 domain-containing protein [Methylobacterium marchantiae]|uniref:DUF4381 domain-containing protein n=1 Tax=Methylobacterium marchantiae TaxID=600331 RepID=A0ABW3WVY5_9HYPH|nr:hypothetical protein AIGOOFII_0504 [Methylobacterium marchantiae]